MLSYYLSKVRCCNVFSTSHPEMPKLEKLKASVSNVLPFIKKKSSKGEPGTSTGGKIYIRISRASIQRDPDHPDQPSSGLLYLIEGTFDEIVPYAGTTLDWVITIARLLCKPLGDGHVYTHPGTTREWYHADRTASWWEVNRGDVLRPGIYEYVTSPRDPIILLSKITNRRVCSFLFSKRKTKLYSAGSFGNHQCFYLPGQCHHLPEPSC
jgi:hypothetical protein